MKLHILLLALGISSVSMSQITITRADFADGGDTVRMSVASDPGVDFSLTGANYTWNFSNLVPNSQELVNFKAMAQASTLASFTFGTFAPPKYQATNFGSSTDLPLAQLTAALPISITDVNLFSKNSNDSITSVGYSFVVQGTEVPFKSDTIETRYKFPMNYGNVYTSRGYSNLDLNPFTNAIWRQHKTRASNVDGWGTITTPYGTFDALRITHYITEFDSIQIEIAGNATWIPIPVPDQVVHEWWAENQLEPVLRVEQSDILGNLTVTKVEYRDSYNPALASVEKHQLDIGVYPNPTTDQLIVQLDDARAFYSVIDVEGSILLEGTFVALSNQLDVSSLSNGNYQLVVRSANHFGIVPFIKN